MSFVLTLSFECFELQYFGGFALSDTAQLMFSFLLDGIFDGRLNSICWMTFCYMKRLVCLNKF